MRVQDVIRSLLALAFFVGAAANAVMLMTAPEIYQCFADLSFLRFYRSLWQRLILPWLGLWMVLVIGFEVAVGVLLLWSGPYARAGLVLAAAYAAFLVPFWWGGGAVINIALFLLMVWLLRFSYPASIPSLLFGG